MFTTRALFAFGFAACALALPTVNVARSDPPGPWCNGLGAGAFDTAFNFSLAAFNLTGTNANSTGAPLVFGQAGAVDGAEFKVLSTWASYPILDIPPVFKLVNGSLLPNDSALPISDSNVSNGQEPSWIVTGGNLPTPVQIYCAVAPTDAAGGGSPFPELAVNGDPDNFSLCPTSLTGPGAQTNVVYKPSPDNGYVAGSCYPVRLQLIGLD